MSQSAELNLSLHPKQGAALSTAATEVLYGGAAGGGKSHLMRVAAVLWCAAIAGLQVYLFRRIREDLVKNHLEGPKGLRAMLAPWAATGFVTIVEDEIRFWNGSKIYLCHCKDEKDRFRYLGAEIHVLLIDELTTFSETIYRFLRNRVRAVGLTLPAGYEGRFPRILCGSNPGNVGHHWVKKTFVDAGEGARRVDPSEGGMLREFIRARLEDNPSMAKDDPGYEDRLRGLGSEALVRAMRWGDWDVVEGAFFDEWRADKHVIAPFEIPQHWLRIRGFDWGGASPFSVGWWAAASEATVRPEGVIPAGALVRYREWYGVARDAAGTPKPNVGLKMTNSAIARGIREREAPHERIDLSVADPSIFAERGGPSIGEEMSREGVHFAPADNTRVARGPISGWAMVRQRLVGQDGRPMLYVFSTCRDFIRTFPALQHDSGHPEDVDTKGEDHIGDETRYVCMARPWTAPAPEERPPTLDYGRIRRDDSDSWKTA